MTMCISPCAEIGASQENALSMRVRLAVGVDQQVLRPARKAEMRARQRLVGAEMLGPAMRRRMRLDRLRIRRLEAEAARAVDRADQHLQHVQRARRLEAVGMGREAAHGVERHRPADKASWRSPFMSVQGWSMTIASSKATRAISAARPRIVSAATPVSAATASGAYFAIEIFLGQQLEGRHGTARPSSSVQRPDSAGRAPFVAVRNDPLGHRLEDQRLAVRVAREQAVFGRARRIDHQPRRVGVAHE